MPFRVLFTEPECGHVEELSLPSLIASRDLVNYLSSWPSCQREETRLPKKSEGLVGPKELMEGEIKPESLGPQVNGSYQKSPAIRTQLDDYGPPQMELTEKSPQAAYSYTNPL